MRPAEKEWTPERAAQALSRVPHRISHIIRPWAETAPDHPALVEGGTIWTYGQLAAHIASTRATLADLGVQPGDRVNLERAVTADKRLGGHIVQGHVDGTATITAREPGESWEVVAFTLPPDLARYVVEKGSITVDGISLTVAAVTDDGFSVSLIPTTLALTTLGRKGVGDLVNLEVDVIAKYVERLTAR